MSIASSASTNILEYNLQKCSIHLSNYLDLSVITSPLFVFSGAVFRTEGSSACFMLSYLARVFSVTKACRICAHNFFQFRLAKCRAGRCARLLASVSAFCDWSDRFFFVRKMYFVFFSR